MKGMLIYNPVAGQYDLSSELDEVVGFLADHGWQTTLRQTRGAGDATTFAREAVATGYDVVVSVGGDGTLGEVANGLAFTNVRMGVLPVGTGNVWAHMLDVPVWTPMEPTALFEAARILVEGQEHVIDLGKAQNRYFVLWSGIGFDAEVAKGVEPHREIRRNLGNITYIVAMLARGLELSGTRATIVIDGKAMRQRIIMVLVSNAQFYGGTVRLAPQAQLDDGLLDVYVFKGDNMFDVLGHILMVLLGKQFENPNLEIYRAREVSVRANKPLAVQVDGDPVGFSPVTIKVVPRALRVLVPRWVPRSLFEDEGRDIELEPSWSDKFREQFTQETVRWREEYEHLRALWEDKLPQRPKPEQKGKESLR
jgi:diacylglycerol kinase (ATP)